jgi:hypothetical protein
MSWKDWGLDPIPDDAPRSAVLRTGGRLLVLGADEWQQVAEELSPRWRVCAVTIPVSSLNPRVGDLVVWRGLPRDDPADWFIWGGPTRIVARADSDKPGHVELCVLEDGAFTDAAASEDDLDGLVGLFAAPSDTDPEDGVVAPDAEWDVLGWWRLAPHCPRCGGPSKPIAYGLVDAETAEHFAIGGCIVSSGHQPRHHTRVK